uniref:Neurexin/syndecan/glycophorin C domain-containing protein n=1 Tax=Astyanax mexicanus TaxID=7994 RepID=A0A8B9I0Z7_ASTMX
MEVNVTGFYFLSFWKIDSFVMNELHIIHNYVKKYIYISVSIIAVVIFTILCTLVFVVRHMFRHKGSYHTNEAKGAESADCADAAIIVNDPAFTETIDESKKEWFI